MAIPRLTSCCCGCSLETGTKIIGCVDTIVLIITIVLSSILANLLDDPSNYPELDSDGINLLYGMFITIIVIGSIQLVIAVMLLIGASQRKPALMVPWLVFSVVYLLMTVITLIVNTIVYANAGMSNAIGSNVSSTLLGLFLRIYYMLVVHSYYKELQEGPMVNAWARGGGYA